MQSNKYTENNVILFLRQSHLISQPHVYLRREFLENVYIYIYFFFLEDPCDAKYVKL